MMKDFRKFAVVSAACLALAGAVGYMPAWELSVRSVSAYEVPTVTKNGITYEIVWNEFLYVEPEDDPNRTYAVYLCSPSLKGVVEIPSEVNGRPVTVVEAWAFFDCPDVTEIVMPESVDTVLGSFYDCTWLQTVTVYNKDALFDSFGQSFPDRTVFCGYKNSTMYFYALEYDGTFQDIETGDVTRYKDYRPLKGSCGEELIWELDPDTGIMTLSGKGEMGEIGSALYQPWAHFAKEIIHLRLPDELTSISSYAFSGCENLENVIIPDSVKSIGKQAFAYCDNLKSVTLPQGITKIDSGTFLLCRRLKNIVIPKTVVRIESQAFRECSALSDITIPFMVNYIGSGAFEDCAGLETITFVSVICELNSSATTICSGKDDDMTAYFNGTIIASPHSYAKRYADKWGYKFKSLYEADEPAPELLLGDVNDDQFVDVSDTVLLARYLAQDQTAAVSDAGLMNADADQSGSVDAADVSKILRMIARLE